MKNIFQKVLKKRLFLFRSLVGFLLLLSSFSPIQVFAANPLTDFSTSLWNSYTMYVITPLSDLISSVFYVLPKPEIIPPVATTTTKVVSKPSTTTPPKTTTITNTIVKNNSPITYVTNTYPTTTIYQTTGLDTSSFVFQGQFNNQGQYNGRNIQALHDEISNSFSTNALIVRNQATVDGDLTVTGSTTFNTVPYTWPNLQGVAGSILQNDGTGQLAWTTLGAASVTPDSLDFSEFKDNLTLDASTDIQSTGTNVFSLTNTGSGNSFQVNDQASDSTPFIIDNAGNVGIGTGSPSTLLHLNGGSNNGVITLQSNAATFMSIYRYSNNVTRGRYEMYKARGTDIAPLVVQANDELGSVDFYGYDGSAFQRNAIILVQAASVAGSTITPRLSFGLGASAAATNYYMTILGNGNVGIGTTAPLKTLDVAGSSRITGTASSTLTGTADPTASTTLVGTSTLFTTELVIGDRITINAETRTVTAIASATSLTVDTAFTDTASASITKLPAIFLTRLSSNAIGMVQNNLGNVGIGTASPADKLHVVSAVTQTGLSIQGSRPTLSFYDSAGTLSGSIDTVVDPIASSRGLEFRTPAASDTAGDNWNSMRFNASTNKIYFGDSGSLSWLQTGHSFFIKANRGSSLPDTSLTPDFSIVSGLVGIGITAPTAALHLKAGTATASSAPLKFTSGTNLTTPEAGAMEYDGTHLFYTNSVPTRLTLATTTDLGSYLKADGTTALTGNWNMGAFNATYTKTGATANTVYDGFLASNTTTASSGNQMYGGYYHSIGQGWATTPATSQPVDFRWGTVPVQGAAAPSGTFNIDTSINGGAFTNVLNISSNSGGITTFPGYMVVAQRYALNSHGFLKDGGADGVLQLSNQPETDFNRLQFGGSTSSFPSIKRNGTALNFRLADNSADAPITAGTGTFSGIVNFTGYNVSAERYGFAISGIGKGYIRNTGTDGVFNLLNAAEADFGRLTFGPATAAFPSIKRNSTALNFRLADDSADAPITAGTGRFSTGIYLGSDASNANWILPFSGNTYSSADATGLNASIFNYNTNATGTQRHFVLTGNQVTAASGITHLSTIIRTFAPTSGTAELNSFSLQPTINQTGGANGITRGIYILPVLTAAADFRALEIAAGKTIIATNGALSAPAFSATGTWITGGTATTTKPYFLIEPTGATSTAWSTTGTGLGINAASGFAGNLLDLQVNGVSKFNVTSGGVITSSGTITATNLNATVNLYMGNFQSGLASSSSGVIRLFNSAETDFSRLQFGGTTNSFNAIGRDAVNGFTLQAADGTATWNDASTAAAGTVANRYLFGIAAPTLTSTNAITDTIASTLYIGGAPTASTNTTITNAYALYVAGGTSSFAGNVGIGTTAPTTGKLQIETAALTDTSLYIYNGGTQQVKITGGAAGINGQVAVGQFSSAAGNGSAAFGAYSSVNGNQSLAMGAETVVTGNNSGGMGRYVQINGTNAYGVGSFINNVSTNSIIIGAGYTASSSALLNNTTSNLLGLGSFSRTPQFQINGFTVRGPVSWTASGTTVTATAHGLTAGEPVIMSGSTANTYHVVTSVIDANTFTLDTPPNTTGSQWRSYGTKNIIEFTNGSTGTVLFDMNKFGNIGISNTAPGYLLHVGSSSTTTGTTVARFENAGGTCDVVPSTTGGITCTSDMRLKKNITTLGGESWSLSNTTIANDATTLDKILALTPVQFNMLAETDGSPLHTGFIAQEVQNIFPDLVRADNQGNLSLNYTGLTPYMVQAIQDMHLEIHDVANLDKPNTFRDALVSWFADVGNGVGELYAKVIHSDKSSTKQLCVTDDSGTETCINKSQLDLLLSHTNESIPQPASPTPPVIPPSTDTTPTTLPSDTPPPPPSDTTQSDTTPVDDVTPPADTTSPSADTPPVVTPPPTETSSQDQSVPLVDTRTPDTTSSPQVTPTP